MSWSKYTWTEFYRDYILPTNWSSKNPLIQKFHFRDRVLQELKGDNLKEWLEKRLNYSNFFLRVHVIWFILMLSIDLWKDWNISIPLQILNILVNLYPSLVQIHTKWRLKKILSNKS